MMLSFSTRGPFFSGFSPAALRGSMEKSQEFANMRLAMFFHWHPVRVWWVFYRLFNRFLPKILTPFGETRMTSHHSPNQEVQNSTSLWRFWDGENLTLSNVKDLQLGGKTGHFRLKRGLKLGIKLSDGEWIFRVKRGGGFSEVTPPNSGFSWRFT